MISPIEPFGLLLIGGAFVASTISGALGLGGGPLLLAMLGSFMPILTVIPLHAALMLGATTTRCWLFRSHVHWPITKPFMFGALFGALLGAKVYLSLPENFVAGAMGTLMLASAWTPTLNWRPTQRRPFFIIGIVQAFLSTLFGFGALIQSLILHTGLGRLQITGTLAVCFTALTLFKLLGFLVLGFAFGPYLWIVCLALIATVIGSWCGKLIADRISEPQFRTAFRIVITIGALRLLYRAFTG